MIGQSRASLHQHPPNSPHLIPPHWFSSEQVSILWISDNHGISSCNERAGSQKQATNSEISPALHLRSLIRRPVYIFICVEVSGCGLSASVNSYTSRIVSSVGFLVTPLTPLAPTILPPHLLQDSQVLPNVRLWVSASVSMGCWVKLFWWVAHQSMSIAEYN